MTVASAERADGTPGRRRTAVEAILASATTVDLVALVTVPAVLVWVFLLPASVVEPWRLAVLDPTVPAAFLSHFVHGSVDHLLSNLLGYALLAPLTYALCVAAGRRREFLVSFATFIVAFPLALSGLNVALVRPSVGYGFSGIVMALLGLMTLAVGWYVEARFDAELDASHAPLGFFLVAGVIAAAAAPPSPLRLAALGLAAFATLLYLTSAVSAAGGLSRLVTSRDVAAPGRVELAVAGLLTALLFPLAAFPPDPVSPGTVLNLYEHALGFCLGFVVPYATFTVLDRLPASA